MISDIGLIHLLKDTGTSGSVFGLTAHAQIPGSLGKAGPDNDIFSPFADH